MLDGASQDRAGVSGLALIDGVSLVILALMVGVALFGGWSFGFTYAGGPISVVMICGTSLWLIGRGIRAVFLASRPVAHALECTGLLLALSLMASITSAVLAAGGKPLIDAELAALDRLLLPGLPWPQMITTLKQHPAIMGALSHVYVSLNWQPFLVVAAVLVSQRDDVLRKFAATWAIGVALCILPFYWLPATGPYPYYAISNGPEHGHMVDLAFHTPAVLELLRSSAPLVISNETITGLVCMPSFHACAAALLAWAFQPWRVLRWPMLLLNGAMVLSAVPIGGHYYVDVIAGCLVALVAIAATELLAQPRRCRLAVSASRSEPALA